MLLSGFSFCVLLFSFPFPSLPFLSFWLCDLHNDTRTQLSPRGKGSASDFLDGKEAVSQASPTDPPSTALHALKA